MCPPIASRTEKHELWGVCVSLLLFLVQGAMITDYGPSCGPDTVQVLQGGASGVLRSPAERGSRWQALNPHSQIRLTVD